MKKKSIILITILIIVIIAVIVGVAIVLNLNKKDDSKQENKIQQTDVTPSVEEILNSMSTQDKIAQMLMPAFRKYNNENVTKVNDDIKMILQKYGFGGVILFSENNDTTEQTVRLIDELQNANAKNGRTQLLVSVDQEGGTITRLNYGTKTPGNMALGSTGDSNNAKEAGKIIGAELKKMGYNLDFAPSVDVNNNPANPIIGVRSFSDDAKTVASMGIEFMKGLQEEKIITSLKHFPGHGDTATDSHTGLPRIDKTYEDLKNNELLPFSECIKNGADMIMTAHIQFPKIITETYNNMSLPATLSKTIITDILRKDMGYDGVVITDAMNMDAIAKNFDSLDAAKLAINAGADIILMPVDTSTKQGIDNLDKYIVSVAKMVDDGEISKNNVDKAVMRILKLKEKYEILNTYTSQNIDERAKQANEFVGSTENHNKEWKIAEKSIVLVKNNDTLPIGNNDDTIVLVPYQSEVMAAEYAFDCLKKDNKMEANVKTKVYLYSEKDINDVKTAVEGYKNVIVITALYSQSELSGDEYKMIEQLTEYEHSIGNKIVIISSNLPYDAAKVQKADAIVLAWCPKGMTEKPGSGLVKSYSVSIPAAIYMVFDKNAQFNGKLPVNIPKLNADNTYSSEILYKREFGLKY